MSTESHPAHKQQATVSSESSEGSQKVDLTFESSLPPPNALREYAKIIPSLPERYMVVFEEQVKHRQREENKSATRYHLRSVFGMILGFILNIGRYALAGWLAYEKMSGASIAAIITAALATIGLFANTTKKKE